MKMFTRKQLHKEIKLKTIAMITWLVSTITGLYLIMTLWLHPDNDILFYASLVDIILWSASGLYLSLDNLRRMA